MIQKFKLTLFGFALIIAAYSVAYACNVPVFRYALERWQADVFEIAVGYKGEETVQLLNELNENAQGDEGGYNYRVNLYDLSDEEAITRSGFTGEQLQMETPFVVIRYPRERMIKEPLATGPLNREFIQQVLHSPLRQQVAERLIDGQTAVWVFLESGDSEQDQKVFETLKTEVEQLHEALRLPDLADNTEADTIELTGPSEDVRIEFSILRLSPDDEWEQYFAEQLMNAENDLYAYEGKPMAFPIYGRGRALYALIGDGIMRDTIQTAGQFLVGPCTCQIKDDNPGVDLLMAVDWQNSLDNFLVRDKMPPAPFASFNDLMRQDETVGSAAAMAASTGGVPEEQPSSSFWQILFIAIGVIVVIDIAALFVWIKRRRASL